jgi:quinol monooxygenase YgiN
MGELVNPPNSRHQPGYAGCTHAPTMVLASVVFRVRPDKRREVLAVMDDIVERLRQTPTCRRCHLLVDTEDPNLFTLTSEWQMAEDADAFFETREFQAVTRVRSLLREEPVLLMDTVHTRATRLVRER